MTGRSFITFLSHFYHILKNTLCQMLKLSPNTNTIAMPGERCKEKMNKYFAYGSNMDKEDLDRWCDKKNFHKITPKSAITAKLVGYRLTFNYFSSSHNCGTANIMEVENGEVYGLLMEIDNDGLQIIRKKEGYPNCYKEVRIWVDSLEGQRIGEAITYKVVKNRELNYHQLPSKEYLCLIISNAIKYRFPYFYIKAINWIKTME